MIDRNAAVIILYNENKKVLLQHRTEDAPILSGFWAFFGGKIKDKEVPETAVKREIIEELNYKLKNPQLKMIQKFEASDHRGTKYVFVEKFDPSQKLELKEGQGMDWFFIPDLRKKKLKIIHHDLEALEYVYEKFLSRT